MPQGFNHSFWRFFPLLAVSLSVCTLCYAALSNTTSEFAGRFRMSFCHSNIMHKMMCINKSILRYVMKNLASTDSKYEFTDFCNFVLL